MSYTPPGMEIVIYVKPALKNVLFVASDFDQNPPSTQASGQTYNTQAVGGWNGGAVEITGIDTQFIPRVLVMSGDVSGTLTLMHTSRVRNLGTRSAGACSVDVGSKLGLFRKVTTLLVVHNNGSTDTGAALDAGGASISVTTAPDGTDFFRIVTHTT